MSDISALGDFPNYMLNVVPKRTPGIPRATYHAHDLLAENDAIDNYKTTQVRYNLLRRMLDAACRIRASDEK